MGRLVGRFVGRIPTTVLGTGFRLSALPTNFIWVGQVVGGEAGIVLARVLAPTANAVA